jgi:hypothetical protein
LVGGATDGHRKDDLIFEPGELTVADKGAAVAQEKAKQCRVGGGVGDVRRRKRHDRDQRGESEGHQW